MRKSTLFLALILLVLIGCRDKRLSSNDSMPWYSGTFAKAQVQAGNNNIMLFFKTEW